MRESGAKQSSDRPAFDFGGRASGDPVAEQKIRCWTSRPRILPYRSSLNLGVSEMATKSRRLARFVASVGDDPVFVGVDVHKHTYSVALFCAADGQIETWNCPADEAGLEEQLKGLGCRIEHVVYETGPTGFSLCQRCAMRGSMPRLSRGHVFLEVRPRVRSPTGSTRRSWRSTSPGGCSDPSRYPRPRRRAIGRWCGGASGWPRRWRSSSRR